MDSQREGGLCVCGGREQGVGDDQDPLEDVCGDPDVAGELRPPGTYAFLICLAHSFMAAKPSSDLLLASDWMSMESYFSLRRLRFLKARIATWRGTMEVGCGSPSEYHLLHVSPRMPLHISIGAGPPLVRVVSVSQSNGMDDPAVSHSSRAW